MKLENFLVLLLSNIIHDRLQMLSDIKENIKKTDDYKKVEDLFSDVNNVVDVDNDSLRKILSDITDSETIDGIISNIDMIKIVLNGMKGGLDLSLDDEQKKFVKGIYDIVNNYRVDLENKNKETRDYLEDFISKCRGLSDEISTGVVRDIDTLDQIFFDNDVSIDDIVKCKYEILRNNSKNYNLNLSVGVKEEIDLRILLKKLNFDFDSYSDIEKRVLVDNFNKESFEQFINYLSDNNIVLSNSQLFIVLIFSNMDIFSDVYKLSSEYGIDFSSLFSVPGVFVSSGVDVKKILSNYKDDSDYYIIENLSFIDSSYELFKNNISILESNNRSVSDCVKSNLLSLFVPDLVKNITILNNVTLSDKEFSIVCINPFLATSMSSFNECGLDDYIKNNPLRLTTSYYRLKLISSNIVNAHKNGKIIFRSLNDKKTYWLNKNITRGD